jgi:hypothetical protein
LQSLVHSQHSSGFGGVFLKYLAILYTAYMNASKTIADVMIH